MTNQLGVEMRDHEECYAVIRADVRVILPRLVFGAAWLLAPFFFLFPLLRLNGLGLVFMLLVAFSGALYLLNLRAGWYGSGLVITNQRCVDVVRRGLGPSVMTAVAWKDIAKVSLVPARAWWRLLGLGAIRLDLASPSPWSFLHSGLRRATLVRDLICEVQSRHTS